MINAMNDGMNSKRRTIVLSMSIIVALGELLAVARIAHANGAVWAIGADSGTPGPMKQSELYLEKEHVIFKGKHVDARFWIVNPSASPITVLMGFPVNTRQAAKYFENPEKARLLSQITTGFAVESEGHLFHASMDESKSEYYGVVFTWEMTFASEKTTEVRISYPLVAESDNADGFGAHYTFTYLTHTGGFWSRPIGDVLIEFHDRPFVDFLTSYFPGTWLLRGTKATLVNIDYEIRPQPYSIDQERGVISWHRTNWTPKRLLDDIRIARKWGYARSNDIGLASNGYYAIPFISKLCGLVPSKGKEREPQFADELGLQDTVLDEKRIHNLWLQAMNHLTQNGWPPRCPENESRLIFIERSIEMLDYLENYLIVTHGEAVSPSMPDRCFSNIPQAADWTSTGRENLSVVRKQKQKMIAWQHEELERMSDWIIDREWLEKPELFWCPPPEVK